MQPEGVAKKTVWLAIAVAALGYFVDIFDLVLFGVVRTRSLADLGVSADQLTAQGEFLIATQMYGMLLGGILFGILGDKKGRLSVLFASIVTYSLANIANGFVDTVGEYALWRFIAGVGLAGELGAGITLVSELMRKEQRGYGTALVAAFGLLGALAASTIGSHEDLDWRTAYFVGGGLGLALLVLRVGVAESGMFQHLRRQQNVARGNFLALFRSRDRLLPYLGIILVGVPIWFVVGVLMFLSPEIGGALGMDPAPTPAEAIFWCYAGLAAGDLASGLLSQWIQSRRLAVAAFLALTTVGIVAYFTVGPRSIAWFKTACFVCGLGTGYWAVFVTMAAEQFGTNLRATVATTVPNFVRGSVPLLIAANAWLRDDVFRDPVKAAVLLAAVVLVVAALVLSRLRETYARDLDFLEH